MAPGSSLLILRGPSGSSWELPLNPRTTPPRHRGARSAAGRGGKGLLESCAVSTPFSHLASALSFIATRSERRSEDHSALDAVAWSQAGSPLALPKGLELEWLGTSGFRLAFEG